jgi:lysylphosphatidylglycerol synthetase-like protein (DUF2156 family)
MAVEYQSITFMVGSYLVILVLLFFIYYELGLAANDPKAFTKNFIRYIFLIIVPVVAVFALMTVLAYSKAVTAYIIFGGIIIKRTRFRRCQY